MSINVNDLENIRKKHSNQTIIFGGGTFDLLHTGHLDFIKKMKGMADIVVIAVSTDKRVKQRKGPTRPIQDEITRAEIIASLKNVNYCLIAPDPDGVEVPTVTILRKLRPNFFMTIDTSWLKYTKILDDLNVKLIISKRLSEDISTSLTIDKIKKQRKNSRLRRLFLKNHHPINQKDYKNIGEINISNLVAAAGTAKPNSVSPI